MNHTAVLRLVWKEYRSQRAFWLVIFAAAIGLQCLLLALMGRELTSSPLHAVAMTLTACYAAGCGAMLFAAETEEETRQILRAVPLSAVELAAGKLSFGLVATFGLGILLTACAAILSLRMRTEVTLTELAVAGVVYLELLLWGVCLSLLCAKVLNALCLAVLVELVVHLVSGVIFQQHIFVWRGGLLVGLAALDLWLIRRWLTPASPWVVPRIALPARSVPRMLAAESAPPWQRSIRRLLWKEFRRAFVPGLALLCLGGLAFVLQTLMGYPDPRFAAPGFFLLSDPIILVTPLILGLWSYRDEQTGRQFRFLTHHGIPGEAIWFSKQAIWLTATLTLTLTFLLIDRILAIPPWPGVRRTTLLTQMLGQHGELSLAPFVLFVLGGYAIGQVFSLLLPRTVTAAFVGLVLTGVFVAWEMLMIVLRVPLLWSVGLIPLALMLTSLMRVSDWLLERNTLRAWLRVAAVPIFVAVLLLVGIASYRVYEIPEPRLSVEMLDVPSRSLTADETKTIRLYEQALFAMHTDLPQPLPPVEETPPTEGGMDMSGDFFPDMGFGEPVPAPAAPVGDAAMMPPVEPEPEPEPKDWTEGWQYAIPAQREWLETHEPSLKLLLEAAQVENGLWKDPAQLGLHEYDSHRFLRLATLAQLSARRLEAEGELDEALTRYLAVLRMARHVARSGGANAWHGAVSLQYRVLEQIPVWAAAEGQSPDRIKAAMNQLNREFGAFPPLSHAISVDHNRMRAALREISDAEWMEWISKNPLLTFFASLFWERQRALRVSELVQSHTLETVAHVSAQLNTRGAELSSWYRENMLPLIVSRSARPEPWNWLQTTPLLDGTQLDGLHPMVLDDPIDLATRQRATLLQLALIGWRLEHGELPARLDALVPDYFEFLPLDPWSGREFGYEPNGFDLPVEPEPFSQTNYDRPFLWSTGPMNRRFVEAISSTTGRRVLRVEWSDVLSAWHIEAGAPFWIPADSAP